MATAKRRTVPPTPEPEAEPVEPPYYEAMHMLPVGAPGALPVYAYSVGDHVSPEDVEKHNWGGLVKVPDQFADVLAQPSAAGEPAPTAGEPTGDNEE